MENVKQLCHLGDLGLDERIILKCILVQYGVNMWTGFNWLRVRFSDGLL
jgi:hypothetical protein